MSGELVSIMAGLVIVFTLVSRPATDRNITAPMLSLAAGLIVFSLAPDRLIEAEQVHLVAELALVVVLFHDASTVRITDLSHDKAVPIRLLAIGFPLALVVTFGASYAFFPALGVAGALLLAGAVTPTDAGLGAPTVLNPIVPLRVRRALNVESGLNDGLATPIVLVALGALADQEGHEQPTFLQVSLVPLTLALLLALVVGLCSAWAIDQSHDREWSSPRGRSIAVLLLPILLFGLAEVVGANGFIAAFVGGLAFGAGSRELQDDHTTAELLETMSDLLGFIVWFLAGGLLLLVFEEGVRWQWVVMAVLVLTVLRIVPVWLSLLGTGFLRPTVLFIGWFGPRGLASIVFALLALEELGPENEVMPDIAGVVALTVLFSVIAHGVTAGPWSARYGAWTSAHHPPIEQEPTGDAPAGGRGRIT